MLRVFRSKPWRAWRCGATHEKPSGLFPASIFLFLWLLCFWLQFFKFFFCLFFSLSLQIQVPPKEPITKDWMKSRVENVDKQIKAMKLKERNFKSAVGNDRVMHFSRVYLFIHFSALVENYTRVGLESTTTPWLPIAIGALEQPDLFCSNVHDELWGSVHSKARNYPSSKPKRYSFTGDLDTDRSTPKDFWYIEWISSDELVMMAGKPITYGYFDWVLEARRIHLLSV